MQSRLDKVTEREERAFELFIKHFRLTVRFFGVWLRRKGVAEREREKWLRNNRCPHCKNSLTEGTTDAVQE